MLDNGETSDISETKNKDMTTVLATIIKIIIDFLDKNIKSFVFVQGSDAKRQRLYQVLINRELELINKHFNILGGTELDIEPFSSNKPYDFFIISKR